MLLMQSAETAASVIVPTYREAENIPALVERTSAAARAAGITIEIIIVDDDSQDGTIEVVERLAAKHPVRLITRTDERGLSSAVLRGFAEAKYDLLVVMDADLQHPPEMVPELVAGLGDDACDFVIGTRYAGGGEIVEDWPVHRRLVSWGAKQMARPLTPLSDPLSGFFAIPKSVWRRAKRVDPIGYKIALELYVKGGCRNPVEVPIKFETRAAGSSKLTLAEQLRYVRHLWRLYQFRFPVLVWIAVATAALLIIGGGWWVFV